MSSSGYILTVVGESASDNFRVEGYKEIVRLDQVIAGFNVNPARTRRCLGVIVVVSRLLAGTGHRGARRSTGNNRRRWV